MNNYKDDVASPRIDLQIFIPAMILVLGLLLPISLSPDKAGEVAGELIGIITTQFGWMYLLGGFVLFGTILWLAFGRYGMVRLGREEDVPDYTKFGWLAMMFCAGMGSSIMNWAFIEPLYFMQGPALGIEAASNKAAEWSVMYSFFHWGLIPYAIYLMPALPIAYMVYVKRCNLFRISEACVGVFGDKVYGPLGRFIDILVILSILGGTATTLGLSVPVLSALFSEAFGVGDSFGLQVSVLLLWTAIFSWSVYRGLSKGIQILSRINTILALVLLIIVFITGPTLFILDLTTNSFGLLLNNFSRISLATDPIEKGGYPQAWTIFYWAWWLAYAPMVGLFVARISKGRTVRELILFGLTYGSLGSWIFFAVWGGYSVYAETSGVLQLSTILSESGLPAAMVAVVTAQPMGYIFMLAFIALFLIFTATTMDSAAFVLASVSSKNLSGNEEPTRSNRVCWALVLGVAAVAMLAMGGLKAVQSSSIVLSFPMLFLMVVLMFSFMRMLKEDHGSSLAPVHLVLREHEIVAVSQPGEQLAYSEEEANTRVAMSARSM